MFVEHIIVRNYTVVNIKVFQSLLLIKILLGFLVRFDVLGI